MSNFDNYRSLPPSDSLPKPSPHYDIILPILTTVRVNHEQCLEIWFGCRIKSVVMFDFESISLVFYNAEDDSPIVIRFNQREQFGTLFNNYTSTVFGFSMATIYAGEFYKNYFRED